MASQANWMLGAAAPGVWMSATGYGEPWTEWSTPRQVRHASEVKRGHAARRPRMAEVVAAVKSLYADELMPFARMVVKRLRERAAAKREEAEGLPKGSVDPATMTDINAKQVRFVCDACEKLKVVSDGSPEYVVLLVGQQDAFLDACCPVDVYPTELWAAAEEYFGGLVGDAAVFPGTRYACAQKLIQRNLPFLEGRTLGQVCHIVQLATTRKLLMTTGDSIIPCRHLAQIPPATWDQVIAGMQQLFHSASEEAIPLASVRNIFRERFQVELNETALGHSNLFNLLNDERCRGVCKLHMQESGQVSLMPVGEEQPSFSSAPYLSFAAMTVMPVPGFSQSAGASSCHKEGKLESGMLLATHGDCDCEGSTIASSSPGSIVEFSASGSSTPRSCASCAEECSSAASSFSEDGFVRRSLSEDVDVSPKSADTDVDLGLTIAVKNTFITVAIADDSSRKIRQRASTAFIKGAPW